MDKERMRVYYETYNKSIDEAILTFYADDAVFEYQDLTLNGKEAVLNFIDERENEEFGLKRGFIEDIGVRRPYRRRGLARALIARSMRMMRDLGMTAGKLGVDTDNLTAALGLYTGLGFEVTKKHIIYQKPLE